MQDFFTVVNQAGSVQELAGLATDHYDIALRTNKMLQASCDERSAAPVERGSPYVDRAAAIADDKSGMGGSFRTLSVDDPMTSLQTLVTSQVVSASLAMIGWWIQR